MGRVQGSQRIQARAPEKRKDEGDQNGNLGTFLKKSEGKIDRATTAEYEPWSTRI